MLDKSVYGMTRVSMSFVCRVYVLCHQVMARVIEAHQLAALLLALRPQEAGAGRADSAMGETEMVEGLRKLLTELVAFMLSLPKSAAVQEAVLRCVAGIARGTLLRLPLAASMSSSAWSSIECELVADTCLPHIATAMHTHRSNARVVMRALDTVVALVRIRRLQARVLQQGVSPRRLLEVIGVYGAHSSASNKAAWVLSLCFAPRLEATRQSSADLQAKQSSAPPPRDAASHTRNSTDTQQDDEGEVPWDGRVDVVLQALMWALGAQELRPLRAVTLMALRRFALGLGPATTLDQKAAKHTATAENEVRHVVGSARGTLSTRGAHDIWVGQETDSICRVGQETESTGAHRLRGFHGLQALPLLVRCIEDDDWVRCVEDDDLAAPHGHDAGVDRSDGAPFDASSLSLRASNASLSLRASDAPFCVPTSLEGGADDADGRCADDCLLLHHAMMAEEMCALLGALLVIGTIVPSQLVPLGLVPRIIKWMSIYRDRLEVVLQATCLLANLVALPVKAANGGTSATGKRGAGADSSNAVEVDKEVVVAEILMQSGTLDAVVQVHKRWAMDGAVTSHILRFLLSLCVVPAPGCASTSSSSSSRWLSGLSRSVQVQQKPNYFLADDVRKTGVHHSILVAVRQYEHALMPQVCRLHSVIGVATWGPQVLTRHSRNKTRRILGYASSSTAAHAAATSLSSLRDTSGVVPDASLCSLRKDKPGGWHLAPSSVLEVATLDAFASSLATLASCAQVAIVASSATSELGTVKS